MRRRRLSRLTISDRVFLSHHRLHPFPRHLEQLLTKLQRRIWLFRELHTLPGVFFKILCWLGRHGTSSWPGSLIIASNNPKFQFQVPCLWKMELVRPAAGLRNESAVSGVV